MSLDYEKMTDIMVPKKLNSKNYCGLKLVLRKKTDILEKWTFQKSGYLKKGIFEKV